MKKATREQARSHNTRLVLKTIYHSGQISRADIARATHLTRPTISAVVSELIEQGLICEVGFAPSTGGKRAVLLSVADDSRHLISLNLSRESFCGAIVNLRGEIKTRVDLFLGEREGEAALDVVYDLVDRLVDATPNPLLGIGIGAPGLVDAIDGVLREAVNLHWKDVPLRALLQERYGLPVYMANDCQLAALAEYTFGGNGRDDGKDLVVINVGWGVGAGIVLNGHLLHGSPLGAGEIGHVRAVKDGPLCQCGNTGCLETQVSTRAILQRARAIAQQDPGSQLHQYAAHPETINLETVCQMFQAGDQAVQGVVRDVGQGLGIAAANLVGVLGSCYIALSGRIRCFGEPLLDTIRHEMSERCLPALARDTEIGFVSLSSDIVLLGASALLMSNELGLFAPT